MSKCKTYIVKVFKEKKEYFNPKTLQRHRSCGPAIEYNDGSILEYWLENKRHRNDGPAVEIYKEDKVILEYWRHGKRHNPIGPAVFKNEKGSITEEYWFNGKIQNKEKALNQIECYKTANSII